MPAADSAGPSATTIPYSVNERYLNSKTAKPLTVRFVGLLPGANDGQTWIGVEYDDLSDGKGHSGVYKDTQVFQTLQPGAGAFIKYAGKATPLTRGASLVAALEERYGPLGDETPPPQQSQSDTAVVLGSSNSAIVVEAPGMSGVRQRMGRLERLKEIGFDREWIAKLGGTEPKRLLFKERLKGVRVLDISNNLIEHWTQVAEITEHLGGLTTLVMNHSRVSSVPEDLSKETLERYQEAFKGITQLHLGDAAYTWEQAVNIARLFPSLQVLDLNHNTLITEISGSTAAAAQSLRCVTSLNLDGCPLRGWAETASALRQLSSLQHLNLADTPIKSIPQCPGTPFPSLTTLSLTETLIARWRDIDHLAEWTGGKLEHLRISCTGDHGDDEEKSLHPVLNAQFMTGNARTDRPFLIAKLAALNHLNGTAVTSAERWDAEVYYLHFINNLNLEHPAATWGRFEELVTLHGPGEKAAPVQTTLKSRLINLNIIPPSGLSFTLRILPSAPVTLLEKKVAKHLQVSSAKVWTARKHESILAAWEPVEELEEGREVGMYASNGDTLVIVA